MSLEEEEVETGTMNNCPIFSGRVIMLRRLSAQANADCADEENQPKATINRSVLFICYENIVIESE